MARHLVTKPAFERAYARLGRRSQDLVDAVPSRFRRYLESGTAPTGLGVKHLGGRTYEFRVGLALRVVYQIEETAVLFVLLGNHDEVRRFLRRQ